MVRIMAVFCISISLLLVNPCVVTCARNPTVHVVINLPSSTLVLFSGESKIKEYPVAIGKPSTPTPVGSYSIYYKEMNPTWIPPGKNYIVPSGPDNPLGYRWLEFLPTYGIHGTNAPWSIGQSVSNGCVRMYEEDVEELYERIKVGTPLLIRYERVAVDIDKQGQVAVMIYPDIYGYEPEVTNELEQKLATLGIGGWVHEGLLDQILQQPAGKKTVIGKVFPILIDDKESEIKAVEQGGSTYVPVWALADALSSTVNWNESEKIVLMNGVSISGIVYGDIIYSTLAHVQKAFPSHVIKVKSSGE